MTIKLKVAKQKDSTEVHSEPFLIRMKEGVFAVTAPIGDMWFHTVNFDLRLNEAVINSEQGFLEITFPSEKILLEFKEWLIEANKKAKEGYRTMHD